MENEEPPELTQRMVWIAVFMTPLLLGSVAELALRREPPSRFVTTEILAILMLVGFAMFGLGFRLPNRIGNAPKPSKLSSDPGGSVPFAVRIVSWMLFEGIAILGFLAVLGGAPVPYFWFFAALSCIGLILTRP
ncbi:MAG TPA: hypothetical protein PLM33_13260 [Acidobacteriota bacterium]|jgi:Na+/H+ antiporter NhaC|nr:hypothetical protein [Acidobacteriota bacterium]HRR26148.1 hypothetical protein [Acidobacteriota bacterium]HRV08392.1 hypothetical protein [Acidobacteriota bacterium]